MPRPIFFLALGLGGFFAVAALVLFCRTLWLVRRGVEAEGRVLRYEVRETLEYAGAYNPLWIFRKGQFLETKADKITIGAGADDQKPFTNHVIGLQKDDCIYLFTDGYADQFGGSKGKKFKYNGLRDLLLEHHRLPMPLQKEILDKTIELWRGSLEQVDDILVIGIRIG